MKNRRYQLIHDNEIIKTSDSVLTLIKYIQKECYSSEGNILSYYYNNFPIIFDSKENLDVTESAFNHYIWGC